MLAMFAAFVVFGVVLVVRTIVAADLAGLAFVILWLAAGAWNVYWWLWRFSHRLDVDGDRLTWSAPLRSGVVDVRDVVAIRGGFVGQSVVFELRDGESIECLARLGIVEFAEAVAGERGIPVTVRVPFGQSFDLRGSRFERR